MTEEEIPYMCKIANADERIQHCKKYYDNIRKQIFTKLDWIAERMLTDVSLKDPITG
jgi:hypothetical protein